MLTDGRIGVDSSKQTYVAIKGTVFDVTGNENYTTGPYKGACVLQDPSWWFCLTRHMKYAPRH